MFFRSTIHAVNNSKSLLQIYVEDFSGILTQIKPFRFVLFMGTQFLVLFKIVLKPETYFAGTNEGFSPSEKAVKVVYFN